MAFGDSDAHTLMPMLNEMAKRYGVGGLAAAYASCPPLLGVVPLYPSGFSACRNFNDTVIETIKKNHIHHVILSARWRSYMSGYLARNSADWNGELFRKGLALMVQRLQSAGAEVWIVKSPPEFAFSVPHQLASTAMTGGDASKVDGPFSNYLWMQAGVETVFDELEKNGVHFIELADDLCPSKKVCLTQQQGHSLYKDDHHLSEFGAMKVQNLFDKVFSSISGGLEENP